MGFCLLSHFVRFYCFMFSLKNSFLSLVLPFEFFMFLS